MSRSQSTPQSSQMIWMEGRIAELERHLESETKDKNSAQESFGTAWSEWQRCEKRIAQLEEVLRLALANLNWCEQAIADLRPQPYPLTLKDARDAINKINEVIG